MQTGATPRDLTIDRQGMGGKRRYHLAIKPGAQRQALSGIASFNPQNALLKFQNSDHRNKKHARINGVCPGDDPRIRRPDLAQLRDDIRIEQEHQSRSAERVARLALGGSKSIASDSGMASTSTMRRLPTKR